MLLLSNAPSTRVSIVPFRERLRAFPPPLPGTCPAAARLPAARRGAAPRKPPAASAGIARERVQLRGRWKVPGRLKRCGPLCSGRKPSAGAARGERGGEPEEVLQEAVLRGDEERKRAAVRRRRVRVGAGRRRAPARLAGGPWQQRREAASEPSVSALFTSAAAAIRNCTTCKWFAGCSSRQPGRAACSTDRPALPPYPHQPR